MNKYKLDVMILGSRHELDFRRFEVIGSINNNYNHRKDSKEYAITGPTINTFTGVSGFTSYTSAGAKSYSQGYSITGSACIVRLADFEGERIEISVPSEDSVEFQPGEPVDVVFYENELVAIHVPRTALVQTRLFEDRSTSASSTHASTYINHKASDALAELVYGPSAKKKHLKEWSFIGRHLSAFKIWWFKKIILIDILIVTGLVSSFISVMLFVNISDAESGNMGVLQLILACVFFGGIGICKISSLKRDDLGGREIQLRLNNGGSADMIIKSEWLKKCNRAGDVIKKSIRRALGYEEAVGNGR